MPTLDQLSINFINNLLNDPHNLTEATITHNHPEPNYSTIIIKALIPNTSNLSLERGINISPLTSNIPHELTTAINNASLKLASNST